MCTPTGKSTKIHARKEHLRRAGRERWHPLRPLLLCAILVFLSITLLQGRSLFFRHLTVDDGLSQNSVYAIIEDHLGYLWLGTADGLNRYDGYGFKTYKSYANDSSTLSNNTIRALYEDASGALWVCTDGGLNRYHRASDSFRRYLSDEHLPPSVRSGYLETICGDQHKNLWIGTGSSIVRLDSTRSQCRTFEAGTKSSGGPLRLTSLTDGLGGIVWIGTTLGLMRYDPQIDTLLAVRLPLGVMDPAVFIVSFDTKDSSLWLCAQRTGIVRFNPYSGAAKLFAFDKRKERSLILNPVASVGEDEDGRILLGSVDEGLFVFDKAAHSFEQYKYDPQDPNSLSFNIVRGIARDRSGTLWVGTDGAGVNTANPRVNRFVHVQHDPRNPHSLPGNFLKAIFQDSDGNLWVGTVGQGLNYLDARTRKWAKYIHVKGSEFSIASNVVFAVQEDRSGSLWVGTDSCLMKMDRRSGMFKRVPFSKAPGSDENHINSIYEDRQGMLWVGTRGAMRVIDPATGDVRIPDLAGQPVKKFRVGNAMGMCEDADGGLWIATLGSGVYRYDPKRKTATHYQRLPNDPNSLSNNYVRAACCDTAGILWFATEEGLERLDPGAGKCTSYTERDGLPSDFLYGILADRKGNLWISTNNGLSRFTAKNPHGSQFRNYRVSDGLQAKEFNTGAFWKNGRGEMFFGGVNGYNVFQPDSIGMNHHPPTVVITGLFSADRQLANEGTIDARKAFRLSYRDNELVIGFVALEYVQPLENRYAYMLEGEDPDWVQAGTQRFARYTNLRPGDYTFRVKASNSDGIWNEDGASIRLTVVPPFWMTTWFLVLAFIAGVSCVAGGVRYLELRKIRRRMLALEAQHALDRERARISQDMHDEVGSTLTRIAILGELAQRDVGRPDETKAQLEKISEMSRHVIDSLGEIVWALNPKNDTLDNLLAYTRQYVAEFFEITPVRCVLDFPDAVPPVPLSAEFRRNIFLTVKEAVHNIVRHAGATEVCVHCAIAGLNISVDVKDNGKGFTSPDPANLGNGLENMQKRIADIGGTITIVSAPAGGTSVSFRVTVPRERQDAEPAVP